MFVSLKSSMVSQIENMFNTCFSDYETLAYFPSLLLTSSLRKLDFYINLESKKKKKDSIDKLYVTNK